MQIAESFYSEANIPARFTQAGFLCAKSYGFPGNYLIQMQNSTFHTSRVTKMADNFHVFVAERHLHL